MLEKEFQYYLDHQAELSKKYNGRFIVIVGDEVVGDYETRDEALEESLVDYDIGTFLIQFCSPGKQAYSQKYHSRAIF